MLLSALKVVFGSLYNDEVTLNPVVIVPILATATMFQLDTIIEKCTEVMLETINPKVTKILSPPPPPKNKEIISFLKTALEYYEASCRYGDKKLKETCIKWFLVNLMTYYYYSPPFLNLKMIPVALMTKLLSSPDLFVMQTEFSIYVMLKYWMYMLIYPPLEEPCTKVINLFYYSRKG